MPTQRIEYQGDMPSGEGAQPSGLRTLDTITDTTTRIVGVLACDQCRNRPATQHDDEGTRICWPCLNDWRKDQALRDTDPDRWEREQHRRRQLAAERNLRT